MAKTSFKKTETPEAEINVDANEAALVEGSEETALAPRTMAAVGQIAGDIDRTDVKLPRIELVYGVGAVSENFDAGDVVLNKEFRLATKGAPVIMTVMSLNKFYTENLPWDPSGETQARTFQTLEEAKEAGLVTEWVNNTPPGVCSCAAILVAVEAPADGDDALFPLIYQEEGEDGELRTATFALWYVKNTSYTKVAKPIISAASMYLKDSLLRGRWELRTSRKTVNGNTTTLPAFRLIGSNSPGYQEFLATCMAQ